MDHWISYMLAMLITLATGYLGIRFGRSIERTKQQTDKAKTSIDSDGIKVPVVDVNVGGVICINGGYFVFTEWDYDSLTQDMRLRFHSLSMHEHHRRGLKSDLKKDGFKND
jgi:hypothetical protein